MTFGQWIKQKRREKCLEARECAERAGMKPQVWSAWENDRTRRSDGEPTQPRIETAHKIALGLDVPVAIVLQAAGLTEALPDLSLEEQEVLTYYRHMPSSMRPFFRRSMAAIAEQSETTAA